MQVAIVGIFSAKKIVDFTRAFIKARKERSKAVPEGSATVAVAKDVTDEKGDAVDVQEKDLAEVAKVRMLVVSNVRR